MNNSVVIKRYAAEDQCRTENVPEPEFLKIIIIEILVHILKKVRNIPITSVNVLPYSVAINKIGIIKTTGNWLLAVELNV
jgi:hypothetical protein